MQPFDLAATQHIAQSFVSFLQMRDPYTAAHLKGTADISRAICHKLGASEMETSTIYYGALLHDIGKNAIPAQLLSKPSRLLPAEYSLIKTHVDQGWQMIKELGFCATIADISHQHHERLDGSGYPNGIKDGQISPAVRIVAVADSVHAMASKRTYRVPLTRAQLIAQLEDGAGTKYDAGVVKVAKDLIQRGLSKITDHI